MLLGCDSHPGSDPVPRRKEGKVQSFGGAEEPEVQHPQLHLCSRHRSLGQGLLVASQPVLDTPNIFITSLDLPGVQLCPCHPQSQGLSLHRQHGQRCPLCTQLPPPPVFASSQGTNKCPCRCPRPWAAAAPAQAARSLLAQVPVQGRASAAGSALLCSAGGWVRADAESRGEDFTPPIW